MTQPETRIPFQQAGIRIEKLEDFEQLRSAIVRVFSTRHVGSFLRLLQRKGAPIRDFDRVMREKLLENIDGELAKGGKSAGQLYGALSISDQAQIRELYLTALEDVEQPLRQRYNKLYRYY